MGRNIVLSAGSTALAVVAFTVGVVAVATPHWATFENRIGSERGHFGAWTVCRQRELEYRCGSHVSRLRPSGYTTAAGVCGVIAVIVAVLMCVTSPVVLAMRVTRRQVFLKFRHAVLAKLIISCAGVTSCILSLIMFGIDMDAKRLGDDIGFYVSRSWSFYLLVLFLLLSMTLCAFAAAEFVLARRLGGDPVKMARDPSGTLAPVIINPAAKSARSRTTSPSNGNGVSALPGSRVPQPPSAVHQRPNGASASNTFNGTPIPYDPRKSPLRSSLKKKQQRGAAEQRPVGSTEELPVTIIHNPAPVTPPAGRSKKVRIQTLDTAV